MSVNPFFLSISKNDFFSSDFVLYFFDVFNDVNNVYGIYFDRRSEAIPTNIQNICSMRK